MENSKKTFLAIIMLDERGNCVSFEPTTFTNYGDWSKEEFDEFFEKAIQNEKFRQEWETNWNSVLYRNEAGIKLILDTMIAAGMYKNTGIDATDFIKPYVEVIMADYFNRREKMSRFNAHLDLIKEKVWSIPKRFFMPKVGSFFMKLMKKILQK